MKQRNKKMIAPIVITVLFLMYMFVYVFIIMTASEWQPAFLLLAVPIVILGGAMVYVLIDRIREIRKGEDDDLSNY